LHFFSYILFEGKADSRDKTHHSDDCAEKDYILSKVGSGILRIEVMNLALRQEVLVELDVKADLEADSEW